jgi:chemotaxis protein methyltransferase CheR
MSKGGAVSIDQQGFSYVCDLVRTHSGVVLEAGKEYLVEARLQPLAQSAGQSTVQSFIERLRSTAPGNTHWNVVEAMTTNETSFFRDHLPFESLRTTVLPALIAARSSERTLQIWSADLECSLLDRPGTI